MPFDAEENATRIVNVFLPLNRWSFKSWKPYRRKNWHAFIWKGDSRQPWEPSDCCKGHNCQANVAQNAFAYATLLSSLLHPRQIFPNSCRDLKDEDRIENSKRTAISFGPMLKTWKIRFQMKGKSKYHSSAFQMSRSTSSNWVVELQIWSLHRS